MATPDDLVDEACATTGLSDLGPSGFMEALSCWVHDLDSPVLSDHGREMLRRVAVSNLRRRLQIIDYLSRHPEIAEVEVPPVVLIAGFPRSGTTLLHNLLSCHPRTRVLQRWELLSPVPAPTSATWATDPRRAQIQATVERLRGTDLERLHWINADDPEECPWGFYDCSGLLGRGVGAVMPRWWQYVQETGSSYTFVEYRRLLQLLLWKNPPQKGTVLVLKSPMTTPNLAQFADVFPDARYVLTHRDPFRVVTSMNAVTDALTSPLCVPGTSLGADDGHHGQSALHSCAVMASTMTSFTARHRDVTTHVHYADLMNDPVQVVTSTLAALNIGVGDDNPRRILTYLARQQAARLAPPSTYRHTYTMRDVWSQPTVASYCSTFNIRPELHRLIQPETPAQP